MHSSFYLLEVREYGENMLRIEKIVRKVGDSLSIIVPSIVARNMFDGEEHLYACMDGSRIYYSKDPASGVCIKVKPRKIARHGNRSYYALTIPAPFARMLGIEKDSAVILEYDPATRMLVVTPRTVSERV